MNSILQPEEVFVTDDFPERRLVLIDEGNPRTARAAGITVARARELWLCFVALLVCLGCLDAFDRAPLR